MTNSSNYNEDKNIGRDLNKKYWGLLDALKALPKDSLQEKELRYQWMKKQPEYDSFVIDMMKACQPKAYLKLENNLNKRNDNFTINPDAGLATTCSKEYDYLVYMESMVRAIKNYTGINKQGTPYTFFESLVKIYRQEAQKAAGKKDTDDDGIVVDVSQKELRYIMPYVRKVIDLQNAKNSKKSIDKLIDECLETSGKQLSKRSKAEIKRRVCGLNIVDRLDKVLLKDEGGNTSLGDMVADPNDMFEYKVFDRTFLENITTNFESKWNVIIDATSKMNRELIKAFLSKDILITLKLKYLPEKSRKSYKDMMEPKCGQWCPRTKCLYADNVRKTGCYIRYKKNGDPEIYNILRFAEDSLYHLVLDNEYVKNAYQDIINDIYDLYSAELKPAKSKCSKGTFQFTDAVLGKSLGEKSAKVSKCRKVYEEVTRTELFNIFYKEH